MRYPPFLSLERSSTADSGVIGLVAPSFGCSADPYLSLYNAALSRLQDMGFQFLEGPNVHLAEGIGKSTTPEKCGAEINDFFLSKPVDAIISCGGGETMCEDLPFIDFAAISKAPPRWYMGFSDNTNLTFTLPVLCDTAAIYGPCISSFGSRLLHPSHQDALDLLTGRKLSFTGYDLWESESLRTEDDPLAPMNPTVPSSLHIHAGGAPATACHFSGRLIGGCLDILSLLCGTSFGKAPEFAEKYKDDGIIWFLEACDLDPLSIRRALWQLDQAGWFAHARGFIIGRSLHFGESIMGMDSDMAYTGLLSKYDVPIILDADIGHLPPMIPIISGALAEVDAGTGSQGRTFSIRYRLA